MLPGHDILVRGANPGRSRLSGGSAAQLVRNPSFTGDDPVMRHYQRRLPHRDTVGEPLFVTFRQTGNLPAHRVFPPDSLARSGKASVAMDRLDRGATRPVCHLRDGWRP
jgi:hypothetical protein